MAQLVAREVWDFDAVGSNPATPTKASCFIDERPLSFVGGNQICLEVKRRFQLNSTTKFVHL